MLLAPDFARAILVMLRSTVPVGSTRNTVLPILENTSNLTAGVDFHIAFSPERTVEGAAMSELTTLPQVVGGLTPKCLEKAISFWRSLTDSVISAESLEAAELVKLINNSYRDLSFAFANGFSLLADKYNLDANRIIGIANEGVTQETQFHALHLVWVDTVLLRIHIYMPPFHLPTLMPHFLFKHVK